MQYFVWWIKQTWRWPSRRRKDSPWGDVQCKLAAELLAVCQEGDVATYEIPRDSFGVLLVLNELGATVFRYTYPLHKEKEWGNRSERTNRSSPSGVRSGPSLSSFG